MVSGFALILILGSSVDPLLLTILFLVGIWAFCTSEICWGMSVFSYKERVNRELMIPGILNLLTFRTGVTFFCVTDFLPGFAIKVEDYCYSVPEECFWSASSWVADVGIRAFPIGFLKREFFL